MPLDPVTERRGAGFWLGAALSLIGALAVILLGGLLAWQGFELVRLGGSSYYLLAGVGLIAAGLMLALRRAFGGLLFALTLLLTVAWALWESGFAFWPLLPRLLGPAVIGIVVMLILLSLRRSPVRGIALAANAAGVLGAVLLLAVGAMNAFSAGQAKAAAPARAAATAPPTGPASEWRFYGRDPGGTRHAPLQQITTENVGQLQEAWRIRTGDVATGGSEDQDTPSQIGDTVYICTPRNIVIAVDADTGKEKWRHDPQIKGGGWNRCRGVGYHETAANPSAAPAAQPASSSALRPSSAPADLCRRRIISTTIDARIFALDAATGQRCPGFGTNGEVDLRPGMGEVKTGFYFPTSAPTIARDMIIIGGWVQDNRELGEPSGVVRAFSVLTGELVWAWDLGNPAITKLPPAGQTYTRGTPNVWSTPAFDDALGLIYLPTGNATPDYWGSHRTDLADEYNSSVVALDIATGRERWHFRTVNHDVWDWDVPAQPMLIDFPTGGGTTPAVLQLTKRGQIFVLDRRTGAPLTPVEEKPTPQGGSAPGEWVAPTQPYSTGMPALQAERLTESMMWGVTPLDQLACRIAFKKLRYEGDFTPQGLTPILQYPGNGGGQNWNSGAYDPATGYLLTPGLRNPITVVLKPSDRPEHQLILAPNRSPKNANARAYRSSNAQFMSPYKLPRLGETKVPCLQPPHGLLNAVDLKTRKLVWQVPLGTAERSGPFGRYSGLKVPVGTFGLGGVITTGGGLAFHGATQDPYLRAYDTATGKVLWKARLPVGAGGTPMTYVSPTSGRQYVVVTAGGARRMPERGDWVIAYALPKR
jgi:quinate dehydrogenase (quinone)